MPAEYIKCPVCHQLMTKRMVMDNMEIDFCEQHGVWLDAGELDQLAHHVGQPMRHESKPASRVAPVARTLGHAAVMGAGFSIGHRLVSGIIDSIFGE